MLSNKFRLHYREQRLPVFWAVMTGLLAVNVWVLYHELFSQGAMSPAVRTVCAVADSLVLFVPFLFARRRWLYLPLLWFLAVTVMAGANILYFRNFNDAISGAAYFTSGNINRFVIDSAIASVRPADIIMLLTSAAALGVTIWASRGNEKPHRRFIAGYLCMAALFLAAEFGLSVRRISIFNHTGLKQSVRQYGESFRLRTDWKSYVMDYGFTGYLVRVAADCIRTPYKVTEEDIAAVRAMIDAKNRIAEPDSARIIRLKANRGRNLILIIVESLNSRVLELDESGTIAPTLMRLAADSTLVCIPDIEAMTGHGRSSDAQFMVNTGILPLRGEALVSRYAAADYPSLAKSLGYPSVELIGENRTLWSHYLTTRSYGYDRLIDNLAPEGTSIAMQDSLILSKSAEEARKMPQPFFMQITTIGMHKPYTRPTGVAMPLRGSYPDTDRHYLEAVHAFDAALANFIASLKRSGIYDRSVIVIVADHEEGAPNLSDTFTGKRIPMLIVNGRLSRTDVQPAPRRQIDIFPTLLDVMGLGTDRRFRGVGRSLLRAPGPADIPTEQAYRISDRLIRSSELREQLSGLL